MQTCFVAMPIEVAVPFLDLYRGDPEHFFPHVYDYLVAPAVEQAGFEPISPSSRGSSVIHADIIGHLESADMVVADLSTLNPNVFFELGIRVALDLPVVLVADALTMEVGLPFDTSIINTHAYDASLEPWSLDSEVAGMAEHIRATAMGDSGNALWRAFGLTIRGSRAPEGTLDARVDFINERLDRLEAALQSESRESEARRRSLRDLYRHQLLTSPPSSQDLFLRGFTAEAEATQRDVELKRRSLDLLIRDLGLGEPKSSAAESSEEMPSDEEGVEGAPD